ncbi:MAG: PaaX domain-containing protein, C- domain protein [Acidimicrobiaceae bacterium]|nr:PaaX domain-containing protein, C- domain protein [Acidimicrobiaceae bacterium]
MRPLNARSIALSTLLGTHPPSLPASSLVALAELFGINGGTMRTALSRLVAAGDVELADGRYTLSARLRARQEAQDSGRRTTTSAWDGRWHTAVATVEHRDLADRRHVRGLMANSRFGELRPTVWMRPSNLAPPALDDDWVVVTGTASGAAPAVLVDRLWSTDDLAARATELGRRLHEVDARLDPHDPRSIPTAFTLAAEILRFLRSDPLLPGELTPADWPVDDLRAAYEGFEHRLQAMLAPFLKASASGA